MLPRNYDFLKFFTARRRSELPTKSAGALITWQFVHDRMEWGLIFLLGGGFALSAGGQATGLNNKIGVYFHTFSGLAKFEMIAAVTTVVQMATEVTSNMTIANIVLPVFAEMVRGRISFTDQSNNNFNSAGDRNQNASPVFDDPCVPELQLFLPPARLDAPKCDRSGLFENQYDGDGEGGNGADDYLPAAALVPLPHVGLRRLSTALHISRVVGPV